MLAVTCGPRSLLLLEHGLFVDKYQAKASARTLYYPVVMELQGATGNSQNDCVQAWTRHVRFPAVAASLIWILVLLASCVPRRRYTKIYVQAEPKPCRTGDGVLAKTQV